MSARSRLLVASVSTLALCYFLVGSLLGRVLGDTTYGQLSVFNEVVRIVLDAYVEPVNIDRAMGGARVGLTDALDGDSAYLESADFKAWQQPRPADDADPGLQLTRRYSFLAVAAVRPGSSAEKAGVKPGDIVKTIDGHHSRPIAAPVGERMMHGAAGSTVKLSLLRANSDPVEVTLTRERPTPQPVTSRALENGAVAYVKLGEITPRSGDEVRAALDTLKRGGAKRMVLDLRGCGYGSVADAPRVGAQFMKPGVLARLAGAKSPEQTLSIGPGTTPWDAPMAVLVDLGTSGAAEVLAAALQESERASLVGEQTFGRAAVQKPVPLDDGGLVLTVATYRTNKGTAIHGKGLKPTVVVDVEELKAASPDMAKDADPVLDKALETLSAPAPVKKAA